MDNTIKKRLQAYGIKKALSYLEKNPKENLPKLIKWLSAFDTNGIVKHQLAVIEPYVSDPTNNWNKLLMSAFDDIDRGVIMKAFENFIINASLLGMEKQKYYSEKYDCNVPWAILMDPTTACNLHCKGCWAADYGNKLNMTYEQLDDIINQGNKLGTYMFIYSGGEPLMRKDDIIKLCEAHPDCEFLAFTNGTLIDEKFAQDMLRVKNFIPALSIEGFEEATDFRRGKGTFKAVVKAMEILKAHKLPFGSSLCYTKVNTDVIGSEEFFDFLIEKGSKFAWIFTLMPVGVDSTPELMATAEQRKFMFHQVRNFRKTKPIFTMDFWNDGEFVNGCIAGGRRYLHINANGDIEPCAFIHYSDSNIKEYTLLEAYQRPLFKEYRKGQPFNDNMLRPCPLLDNYGRLAEMVDESGAKSTDFAKPEDVHNLCAKCKEKSEAWAVTSAELWDSYDHHLAHPTRK